MKPPPACSDDIIANLLGFDLRVDPSHQRSQLVVWSKEERLKYLCRKDATVPLSVSDYVWPSWKPSQFLEWADSAGLAVCAQLGLFLSEKDTLEARRSLRLDNAVAIAISLHLTRADLKPCRRYFLDPTHLPPLPQERLRLIGFDVVEPDTYSAISSFDYGDGWREIRRQYVSHLNEHNLFQHISHALECAVLMNENEAHQYGHWPYFVFGLWFLNCDSASSSSDSVPRADHLQASK